MDQELELKDVVRKLREDLQAVMEDGRDEAIKFKMDSIELELKVAARKEVGPHGGIKFSVLGIGAELGASAKWAAEQMQTIKFKMTPESRTGPLTVAGKTKERPATPRDGG